MDDETERELKERQARWHRETRDGADAPHSGNGRIHEDDVLPLKITNPVEFQDLVIPERRWAVADWVPEPLITGLYGDGGMGKSLLLQMLLTSAALGRSWLGIPIRKMRSLAIFCEDPEEELQRRQADINRHYGVDMQDLDNMCWINRFGADNLLMEFEGMARRGTPTPFYRQVVEIVADFRPEIILIDTVADTFGGNENDRGQARYFVQVGLGGLARLIDGAVVASAHPSRAGLRSREGDSGSTAWNAAFRSRLYLSTPERPEGVADGDDKAPDTNERVLERKKANYAPRAESIRLRWHDGVFAPIAPPSHNIVDQVDLDNRVLDEMRAMIETGAKLPSDWNTHHGFANVVRKRSGFSAYSQQAIVAAQDRLIKTGRAVNVSMGPPSKRRQYIRPIDLRYAGEAAPPSASEASSEGGFQGGFQGGAEGFQGPFENAETTSKGQEAQTINANALPSAKSSRVSKKGPEGFQGPSKGFQGPSEAPFQGHSKGVPRGSDGVCFHPPYNPPDPRSGSEGAQGGARPILGSSAIDHPSIGEESSQAPSEGVPGKIPSTPSSIVSEPETAAPARLSASKCAALGALGYRPEEIASLSLAEAIVILAEGTRP
ncbi:MAG: AAA family ATPase [Stellaceae bacterium]